MIDRALISLATLVVFYHSNSGDWLFVLQTTVSAKCSDMLWTDTKIKQVTVQHIHPVAEPVFLILRGCEMFSPFVWVVFPIWFVCALESIFTN